MNSKNICPPHNSAHLHVSGEAKYIDDFQKMPGELVVALLLSPHAKARIKKIYTQKALALDGVACVLTAKDIKHNLWGSILAEQPLLAEQEVNYAGEVVAIVAAENNDLAHEALKLIEVEYEVLPAVLSLGEAIKLESTIGWPMCIKRGDAKKALKNAKHHLSGEIAIKGADHFYLENQAAIVYPEENNSFRVYSSTQHPTETQSLVAEALGIDFASVICTAQRLGGGFGGKETQAAPFAAYAALVAQKTKKPTRLILTKDEDMVITGKRNPYLVKYQVAFDEKGKILGLKARFFGDGGAYADLSTSILERALCHADNAYFLPNVHLEGQVYRTNFHPHTAFRGFGGPKGIAMIEHIIEEVAFSLKIDSLIVRKLNCYRGKNNLTPYQQKVENNLLPKLFSTLEKTCDYKKRQKQIELWNKQNQHSSRGLSLTAVKFGISFTTRFLNQGHALLHILRDGSIQVATGGVEMGQGVEARIKMVVAETLGVPLKKVHMLATCTDKSANTSPTAASSGTDLNASAALNAALKIKKSLSSIFCQIINQPSELWPQKTASLASQAELLPKAHKELVVFQESRVFLANEPHKFLSFTQVVEAAYLSRVPLSAYGFYKTKNLDFNKTLGQGRAFLYFTQGVAASEVEVNHLSGEVKILRSDILMDIGQPINEELDKGQVAGAFIQGVGWVTSEVLVYNEQGQLKTHAPSTYKIPSIHDIPRVFNINFLPNPKNKVNIYGTKAVGEPPLMLCFSVHNAIKKALAHKAQKFPSLPIPACDEEILKFLYPHSFKVNDAAKIHESRH